ncbi:MAG: hypothetical protein ACH253_01875, partial [Candidatus Thiodiazotropha sp.]
INHNTGANEIVDNHTQSTRRSAMARYKDWIGARENGVNCTYSKKISNPAYTSSTHYRTQY